jgi:PAS domain S-box-containing protein
MDAGVSVQGMINQKDENFFRHMCLSAGVALIATDEQFRITFWNSAAGRIFGASAETALGASIFSIVPHERRELALRLIERALQKREISDFEFPHRNPQGQAMYLAVTISPIIDEGGHAVGVSVYIREVTRRIELEREVAEAQKMSALGAMAGGVAHHFNNVIGGIITSIDFAQNSDNPKTLRRTLETTVAALSRASQLTLSLLAFAEGDHSDTLTRDMTEIVKQFVETLQSRLAPLKIEVESDIQSVRAIMPVKRIMTILEGVTANATEAMPYGGTLLIQLLPNGPGQIMLRVSDSGSGITADDLPRVFEPFFTTKGEDPANPHAHLGLGLAVVHGVVKELGGNVTIESTMGEGTRCEIVLPALAATKSHV